MFPIISSFMPAAEIEVLRQRMFEDLTVVYELLKPEQLRALRQLGTLRTDDAFADSSQLGALSQAERLSLRSLMTYTQARYCKLNFITPAEHRLGYWMSVEEARCACTVFGNRSDDRGLIDESIEMNLLPVHLYGDSTLISVPEFQDWHATAAARVRAGRPETFQYNYTWVRDEAA